MAEDNKRKRYKQRLDPSYSKKEVCEQTHKIWTKKTQCLTEKGIISHLYYIPLL